MLSFNSPINEQSKAGVVTLPANVETALDAFVSLDVDAAATSSSSGASTTDNTPNSTQGTGMKGEAAKNIQPLTNLNKILKRLVAEPENKVLRKMRKDMMVRVLFSEENLEKLMPVLALVVAV